MWLQDVLRIELRASISRVMNVFEIDAIFGLSLCGSEHALPGLRKAVS